MLSWIGDIVGAKSAYRERKASQSFDSNQAIRQRAWEAEQADIAREFSSAQAAITRDWSSAEAATARDFNERMSSTQNQRAAADLEAAGLNRILALGRPAGSAGAPMPSGATAQTAKGSGGQARSAGKFTFPKPTGFMEMMQGKLLDAQADLTSAQEANVREQTRGLGATSDMKEGLAIPISTVLEWLGRSGDAARNIKGFIERWVQDRLDVSQRVHGNKGFNQPGNASGGGPTTIYIRKGKDD